MPDLQETLGIVRDRIQRWLEMSFGLTEDDTKASLIEPLLQALGWDVYDPQEVKRGYRHKSEDNPVDYALLLDRKPCLFLEAKVLGRDLGDRRWKVQAVNYANTAGVEWCILTDGNFWQVYRSNAPGEVEKKLFLETCIFSGEDKSSPREPVEVLSYLCKAAIREKGLDALWRTENVFMRTEQALRELVERKDSRLVSLLRKCTELHKKEVLAALERIQIGISSRIFPPIPPIVPRTAGEGPTRRRERQGVRVPGLPTQTELEIPLLRTILRKGGEINVSKQIEEVLRELADEFNLTQDQRSKMTERGDVSVWYNHIAFTRLRLVHSGDIDNSRRGIWALTEKGRRRAQTGA